jgi:cephalosporin-C deacetylase-like acetyl esterase
MRHLLASLFLLTATLSAAEPAPLPSSTPWNLEKLNQPPKFEWVDEKSPVRTLIYTGEPFAGKPSRVFAVYATPATLSGHADDKGLWPAVVCVHGGGGTAFPEWVTLWAKHGYAAIAMDLSGMVPDLAAPNDAMKRTPLEGGGPNQGDNAKFFAIDTDDLSDDWPYHAVANVILAHSLIRSMPGVDANRTALTGISWGGYTTCIAGSVDSRFKAAVPVYGCGFLWENSVWLKHFDKMGPEKTARWSKLYDPSQYLPSCRTPMFFINGTNDFAYPLDSYSKCFDLVTAPKNIRLEIKMKHGHPEGWNPPEIAAFIDSQLLGKPKLPLLDRPTEKDGAAAAVVHDASIQSAELEFTTAEGPINKLEWEHAPATLGSDGKISAPVPANVRIYYFSATTANGLMVSSPVVIKKR